MLQRGTTAALFAGVLLAGGCAPSGTAPTGGADKATRPEAQRDIASKTDAPVMGKPSRGPRQIDYNNPTTDDIQVLVRRAVEAYKHNGDYKAFDDFMTPGSQFVAGRSYIFAYDYSGRCLADWGSPAQVGSVVTEGTNEDVKQFFRDAAAKAKSGGGWITTRAPVPGSTEIRPKECFVINVEDKLFLGSGIYR